MPPLHMTIRRNWTIHVDERSREIGWTIGSQVFRSRLESGRLGSEVHYDLAVPYNEGEPLKTWRVGLPQFHRGLPRDGRLLRLDAPDGNVILLEFWYEHLGIPGSLLCELFANLTPIPPEEMNDAQVVEAHRTHAAASADPKRRSGKAERHLQREEN